MTDESELDAPLEYSRQQRAVAYGVHIYTATGLLCATLIAREIYLGRYSWAFVWMILAVLIDATDGTLARKFRVKQVVPHIDGRKLDDIVDYLNYTFLPLVLIGWAQWLPRPVWLWVGIPLIASVFAFSNVGAKEEDDGFFLGFPSYWNIFAFYVAVWFQQVGPWFVLGCVLFLSVLSVLPVRFVYPNRPPKWRNFFVGGGVVWLITACAMLYQYHADNQVEPWLTGISLVYPVLYVILSVYLDLENRRNRAVTATPPLDV